MSLFPRSLLLLLRPLRRPLLPHLLASRWRVLSLASLTLAFHSFLFALEAAFPSSSSPSPPPSPSIPRTLPKIPDPPFFFLLPPPSTMGSSFATATGHPFPLLLPPPGDARLVVGAILPYFSLPKI